MRKKLNRLIFLITVVVSAIAVVDQMRRPEWERTWHGRVGFIPYDFRRPTARRYLDAWWNPEETRLFVPRVFGVGWDVNFHRLYTLVMRPARSDGDG